MIYCRPNLQTHGETALDFCIGGMSVESHPGLRFDREAVRSMLWRTVSDPGCFAQALVDGDQVLAMVVAVVQPMPWFERCEAIVIMCRSIHPGAGAKLVRMLMDWARENPMVRRVVFPLEFHADPRQALMLKRMGFDSTQQTLYWFKE